MNKKMKYFVLIVVSVLAIVLFACGAGEKEQSEVNDTNGISENSNIESSESVGMEQEADSSTYTESSTEQETEVQEQLDFGIQTKLDEVEEQVATLEEKLYGDESLTQADMNDLSYKIYIVWDELLNELWDILKQNLDEETMEELLAEQRVWITDKEAEIKQAGEEVSGGSMAPLVRNQTAAKLTRIRVYELACYLGYTGEVPENDFSE